MNSATLLPNARSFAKLHWTSYLALGWFLGVCSLVTPDAFPLLPGGLLAGSLVGLIALTVASLSRQFKRLGLQVPTLWVGPLGPHLPDAVISAPRKARAVLAVSAPAIYLLGGLVTLPFLVRAGGIEGVMAAWDWWSWEMVVARFSALSFLLAICQALPFFPLSGASLLQSVIGSVDITCRISQLIAISLAIIYWQQPLLLLIAGCFVVTAELRRRRSTANNGPST